MKDRIIDLSAVRPDGYATVQVNDVRPGTVLIADGGFDCLRPLERCQVHANADGELCVPCDTGEHVLVSDNGVTYSGFWLQPVPPAQSTAVPDAMMAH